MPAFVASYTAEQRAAIVRAVLGDGMSVRAALDKGKAGELPGLSAGDTEDLQRLTYTYACQWVREAREESNGVQRSRAGADTVTRSATVLLLRRAERDAEKIANARKGLMDADAAIKTLSVIAKAQSVLQALEPKKPGAKTETAKTRKPKSLAEQIAANGDSEPDDTPTDETMHEVSALATNGEEETTMDEPNAGPVRSLARAGDSSVSLALAAGA